MNRRGFVGAALTAAVTSLAHGGAGEHAGGQSHCSAWSHALIINALGDLSDPNPDARTKPAAAQAVDGFDPHEITARVINDAAASGLTAVNVTMGYVSGGMEPFEYTIAEIAKWDAALHAHARHLLKVRVAADLLRAKSEDRIGLIYGFQNAAMVGTDPARVDIFANLGVRVIQLTYNPANPLGGGSMAETTGLTSLGGDVVERLNANRVMVDLSHSGRQTCLDAARVSRQPISINHTGCRALNDVPRNKSDEELHLVASRGGFVGIYFMPFLDPNGHATADEVVAHIDHAVSVCGEDHVGIGTDGPVTPIDDLESYKGHLAGEIAARRAAGISAAGEGPDTFPFVVDLRGVTQFSDLADRLQRHGYTTGRIEKILGRNFLRYAQEVWG